MARNVLAKVPKKFKQELANDLRSIYLEICYALAA